LLKTFKFVAWDRGPGDRRIQTERDGSLNLDAIESVLPRKLDGVQGEVLQVKTRSGDKLYLDMTHEEFERQIGQPPASNDSLTITGYVKAEGSLILVDPGALSIWLADFIANENHTPAAAHLEDFAGSHGLFLPTGAVRFSFATNGQFDTLVLKKRG